MPESTLREKANDKVDEIFSKLFTASIDVKERGKIKKIDFVTAMEVLCKDFAIEPRRAERLVRANLRNGILLNFHEDMYLGHEDSDMKMKPINPDELLKISKEELADLIQAEYKRAIYKLVGEKTKERWR